MCGRWNRWQTSRTCVGVSRPHWQLSSSATFEFMRHPLPVLTKLIQEQRSQTNWSWPQPNDRLTLPSGIITFFDNDLSQSWTTINPLFVVWSIYIRSSEDFWALGLPSTCFHDGCCMRWDMAMSIHNPRLPTFRCCGKLLVNQQGRYHCTYMLAHSVCLIFYVLLGRPWIQDHWCVSSSWHRVSRLL